MILFHATGSVPGGFVGVDAFFVISGYLITGILLREMEAGKFSFSGFWERRVRRIMPASAAMSLAVLVMGYFILLPEDYAKMGASLMAHALMVSNVFFWSESGYFAPGSDQKPLLHTWSLGVEEQFYFIFPFLCWALMCWQLRKPSGTNLRALFFRAFASLLLLSLAASVWMVAIDATMGYYLFPSRAWELLMGAALACLPAQWRMAPLQWCQRMSIVGLLLILGSAMLIEDTTPFPGLFALPPCLGAALLIWAHGPEQPSSPNFWLRRLFESRAAVGLGLISYSLYLWHWPLLAFWDYIDGSFSRRLSEVARLILVLASLGISYASWRWIETPFRKKSATTRRSTSLLTAAGSIGVLALMGWAVVQQAGFPSRWTERALNFVRVRNAAKPGMSNDLEAILAGKPPRFGSTAPGAPMHVLVWGDSHAHCEYHALASLCEENGKAGCLAAFSSTRPLLGYNKKSETGLGNQSEAWGQGILKIIRDQKIPHVVLIANWRRIPKSRQVEFQAALVDTVRQVSEAGARAWVVLDIPGHEVPIPRALALHCTMPSIFPDPSALAPTEAMHRKNNAVMEETASAVIKAGGEILDAAPPFIDANGRCIVVDNDVCLYADLHHVSYEGALRLKPLFAPLFATDPVSSTSAAR